MLKELFNIIINWYLAHINYGTITLLMAIESSFIPLPSELVIPPAAWKAAQGELNIYLVVVFSTLGAILGALFNYFFALTLGRAIIYSFAESRVGKLFFLSRAKIENAEAYFVRHGRSSTLIGRLVPGVRHLISLPAGLARMNLRNFILFTLIGSTAWHSILAALGYFLYSQKELLDKYFNELSWILIALGVGFGIYLLYRFRKKHE
jgi:membrane protein DedA with SNARE-associated domain